MIKKAPITMAYQVNLYCDKCGQIMRFIRMDFQKNDNEPSFVYRCECGHEEMSKKQYPHQILHFDLGRSEVLEAEE